MPIDVLHVRNGDELQLAALVERFQPDGVLLVDGAVAHRHDGQIHVKEAEVSGLPRRDDVVIGPADQNHLLELQKIFPELRRVLWQHLVVDVGKEVAVAQIKLSLVRVVPVIADGRFLPDSGVEKFVGRLGEERREDQVEEGIAVLSSLRAAEGDEALHVVVLVELDQRPSEKSTLAVAQHVNTFGMRLEDLFEVGEERFDLAERVLEALPVVVLVDDVNFSPRMALKETF